MNLLDFFAMGGQKRREMLDDYVDGLNLERFMPPQFRPAGQFVNEMNPVNAMGSAMQDASVVFDPEQTSAARLAAARDMGMEMAMTLAPAALVRMGYLAAPAGLAETFALPVGVDQLATDALSDVKYAARSVADGDMQGLIDVLTPSRDAQSLSAASSSDNAPVDVTPRFATQYSPSRRAAENLKQNKGTYKQMRAMMLKNGAKENELQWSGIDEYFKDDDVVTKDHLVRWLTASDPRLERTVREATGVTGQGMPGHMEMVNRYIDQNLEDETRYYLEDYGQERLNDEYRPVTDLDDVELIDVANYEGYDEDQLDEFLDDYKGYWISDQQELFSNENAALADALGGYNTPEEGAEALARDRLEEDATYNLTYEELMDAIGLDEDDAFYEGETQYGDYFPLGAREYSENIYKYQPEDDGFPEDRVAGASHFGDDDELAQFHTRTGIFPLAHTGDGQRAYYVGEIQSDAQQNIDKDRLLTYGEGLKLGGLESITKDLTNESVRYSMLAHTGEADLRQTVIDIMTDANATVSAGMEPQREIYDALYRQAVLDDHNFRMTTTGQATMPSKVSELNADQLNQINSLMMQPAIQPIAKNENMLVRAMLNNPDILPPNNPITTQVLIPAMTERANNLNRSRAFANTANNQERYFLEDNPELEDKMARGLGGPLMGSQNQWVDYALRSELTAAVNDPTVDYFALPHSDYAIGKVGGTSAPKQGAINFYQRDVANRLKKILKQHNLDVNIGPLRLDGEAYGEKPFKAQGIWLRPEIRDQIKRSGLPTFAAFGAMPLLGVFDYLREQKEKRNERLGGLMGYGGL